MRTFSERWAINVHTDVRRKVLTQCEHFPKGGSLMFAWTREGRIDTVRTSSERWTINVRPNKGEGEGLTQCELFPKGGP